MCWRSASVCETVVPFCLSPPLEPSLPWEPCRPGNKQSFESTVTTVPSSQTANLHSCANRKPQMRSPCRQRKERGGVLASTCAFIIAHQNKHRQAGVLRCSGDQQIKSFFSNHPHGSKTTENLSCWFIWWHRFVLIKPMHSLELSINMSIAFHKFACWCPRGFISVNSSVKWTTLVNVSYIWLNPDMNEINSSDSPFCTLTRTQKPF